METGLNVEVFLSVKISKDVERKFLAEIEQDILKQMEARLLAARTRVGDTIYNYLRQAINDSPEVEALESGDLRFDLGVKPEEVSNVKDEIISIIASTTRMIVSRTKSNIEYRIEMVKSDYTDMLSIVGASFESKNGFEIPWLQWLLLSGHEQVVKSYHVKYVDYPHRGSRSGGALMVNGGSYSIIPSEFTGTASDNFITRSLDKLFPEVEKILLNVLS